jgi:hypothetical protein
MSTKQFVASNVCAFVFLAGLLSGCGGGPSTSDGENVLSIKCKSVAKVTGFKIIRLEKTGESTYFMSYEAEFEYLEDVYIGPGGSLAPIRPSPGDSPSVLKKVNKGERRRVSGVLEFSRGIPLLMAYKDWNVYTLRASC